MIGISKLYCGAVEPADVLRYNRESGKLPSELLQFSRDKKPVVVWNCTQTCNLRCVHCYAGSECKSYEGEMSSGEAKAMIDDLSAFGAPVLLFSGGEPCMREDVVELMQHAKDRGMRVVLSTNGTLITPELAARFADVGLSYVGVSLDGARETHDEFRGLPGSFDRAIEGMRNAKAAGIKVGLRMTVNKRNWREIGDVFDIMEAEGVKRACFYTSCTRGGGARSWMRTSTMPRRVRLCASSWTGRATGSTGAGRPRSSRWTTTPTGPSSTWSFCARTRHAPKRCCSCSNGTAATPRARASGA